MEDGQQTIYYAMLQAKPEAQCMYAMLQQWIMYILTHFIVVILKRKFDDSLLTYVAYSLEGDITDFEFFDDKEIGVLTQMNKETTVLRAISLTDASFQTLTHGKLVPSDMPHVRSQLLQRMIQVKLGCNGAPRRRVLSVVASNGLLKVYYMDKSEEQDDSSEEEEEEGEQA